MTTEEKLKGIIEAQVKGGYDQYDPLIDGRPIAVDLSAKYVIGVGKLGGRSSCQLLEILLDPQGLRAAYPDPVISYKYSREGKTGTVNQIIKRRSGKLQWRDFACRILDTWLSSDGNAAQTIDKAFSLLPK